MLSTFPVSNFVRFDEIHAGHGRVEAPQFKHSNYFRLQPDSPYSVTKVRNDCLDVRPIILNGTLPFVGFTIGFSSNTEKDVLFKHMYVWMQLTDRTPVTLNYDVGEVEKNTAYLSRLKIWHGLPEKQREVIIGQPNTHNHIRNLREVIEELVNKGLPVAIEWKETATILTTGKRSDTQEPDPAFYQIMPLVSAPEEIQKAYIAAKEIPLY